MKLSRRGFIQGVAAFAGLAIVTELPEVAAAAVLNRPTGQQDQPASEGQYSPANVGSHPLNWNRRIRRAMAAGHTAKVKRLKMAQARRYRLNWTCTSNADGREYSLPTGQPAQPNQPPIFSSPVQHT